MNEVRMMKMNKFRNRYVKYLIKKQGLFYGFLAVGIALFFILSMQVKLSITKTYECEIVGSHIRVEDDINLMGKKVYLYQDRDNKIFPCLVVDSYQEDGSTYFIMNENLIYDVENTEALPLEDTVLLEKYMVTYVDVPIGKESLLKRIFYKAGRN